MTRRRLSYPVAALAVLGVLLTLCLPLAAHGAMSDEDFARLCRKGTAQQVRDALRNGANPNATNRFHEETALMHAARSNTPEVVSILLKAGAEVNAKTEKGRTALGFAASSNTPEVVSILLKAGAKVDSDAMVSAGSNEDPEVVSILLKAGGDVNAKDKYGKTALMYAARYSTPEVVSLLLTAGAEVNAKDKDGWTALRDAASSNTPEVVSILLKAGAKVNPNAMFYVGFNKNPEVVSILLKAGGDVNAKDKYGDTALMWAAYFHNLGVVSLLLKAGADVNARSGLGEPLNQHQGETVLMWAIPTSNEIRRSYEYYLAKEKARETGKPEEEIYAQYHKKAEDKILKILPILLDAGANVIATDTDGKTARDIAIERGFMDVAQILMVAEWKQRPEQEAAQRKRLIIWGIILTVIAVVGGFMFMKHRKKILAHVPGNLDDVKENLKKAKDGLSGIAGTVGNAVKEKLKEGNFDGVKEKLREAKDGLSGIAGTMESSVKEKVKEAEKRVGKAPESEQSPMSPEQPSQSTSATPPAQPTPAAQPTPQAPATPEPETMKLARQGMELLKQGDFDTAEQCFNRILKLNPKSANAYTGKLMLAHRARNANELVASSTPLEDDDLFKSALKYAGPKLRAALEQYVRINRARIAKAKQQAAAQEAQDLGNGKAV